MFHILPKGSAIPKDSARNFPKFPFSLSATAIQFPPGVSSYKFKNKQSNELSEVTEGEGMKEDSIYVRQLTKDDLSAVSKIDAQITGKERKDLWAHRFDAYAGGIRPPWACLVAEQRGHVVGFLFGWSSGWEFGIAGEVGWIDILGVDPVYRGKQVGRALVERFIENAQQRRAIEQVFTLVDVDNAGLNGFFASLGFTPGKMKHLQKRTVS
jgi:GNAT superfamily N-acetyltransferase